MTEEILMILNLLRDGNISAAEAERLLRAVRETAPQTAAPPPSPPPSASPSLLGQAAKAAGQAASLAGRALDFLPKPKTDASKFGDKVNEAASEMLRAAKSAAQDVASEVGKITQQARQSLHFDGPPSFGMNADRPANRTGQPEAAETAHSDITWSGAERLVLMNAYGNVKVMGQDSPLGTAQATLKKTAWSESDNAARVLLQQVFLVNRVEGGACRVEIIAPSDAAGRLTVDYEIVVPQNVAVEVQTTFGAVEAQGTSPALVVRSQSGRLAVRRPSPVGNGDARLATASGDILIDGWNAPDGSLRVETLSGDVEAQDAHCGREMLLSARSGAIAVTNGSAGTRAGVETLSGSIRLTQMRAENVQAETVSGHVSLREVSGALTLKAVSGGVDAQSLNCPAVSLNATSSSARLAFAAPFSGSLAGTTVSGEVKVILWDSSDTRVEMSTTSGSLSCTLPLAERSDDGTRHLAGKIGDGIGSIKLQSVSGDLRIEAQH